MKNLNYTSLAVIILLICGCDHPIKIIGDGDVLSETGTRNCYLEDARAGNENCTKNTVVGPYFETYYAVPRSGWEFSGWRNYCEDGAANMNGGCRFNVDGGTVSKAWGTTAPALIAVFSQMQAGGLADKLGIWDGRGQQPGLSWSIRIEIGTNRQLVRYESLSCGGFLSLLEESNTQLLFRETITYGTNRCLDQGLVELTAESESKLIFRYYQSIQARDRGILLASGFVIKAG